MESLKQREDIQIQMRIIKRETCSEGQIVSVLRCGKITSSTTGIIIEESPKGDREWLTRRLIIDCSASYQVKISSTTLI